MENEKSVFDISSLNIQDSRKIRKIHFQKHVISLKGHPERRDIGRDKMGSKLNLKQKKEMKWVIAQHMET